MISPTNLSEWLDLGAIVVSLSALASSGFRYVKIQNTAAMQKKFDDFFRTVLRFHNADESLLSQKSAIYELRNYPEQYFDSPLRDELADEFRATISKLRRKWFSND
jgi:hypothetical protein